MEQKIAKHVEFVKEVFGFYSEDINEKSSWVDILAAYRFEYAIIDKLRKSAMCGYVVSSVALDNESRVALEERPYASDLKSMWRDSVIWPVGGNWLTIMPNGDKIFVDFYPKATQKTEEFKQMTLIDITIVTSLPVCYKGETLPFVAGYHQNTRAINVHYEDELPAQCRAWVL